MEIKRIGDVRCTVGEGPLWDAGEQRLYFVDLIGQALWRHDPATGAFESWPLPQAVAAVTLDEAGGIQLALGDGFYAFDPADGMLRLRARADLPAGVLLNDGKVDRQGRFVAAAMTRSMQSPDAGLYRLEGDAAVLLDEGYVIGNGPCWSVDGKTFYCSDSIPKLIHAYDYDLATGALSNRRRFADTTALGGIPDGATIDASGRMWMAICGAGKIACFSPDGSVERVIEMPTAWVSSVMFGGAALDRLYVTSLDPTGVGLPADAGCGYLYVVDGLGATGLAETRMAV